MTRREGGWPVIIKNTHCEVQGLKPLEHRNALRGVVQVKERNLQRILLQEMKLDFFRNLPFVPSRRLRKLHLVLSGEARSAARRSNLIDPLAIVKTPQFGNAKKKTLLPLCLMFDDPHYLPDCYGNGL
jgi:hypothetical protein